MDKIIIEVFDGVQMSGCSGCSGCSAAGIGVKAATEQIASKIKNMYHGQDIEIIYIDTAETGLTNYPAVRQAVNRGYSFPIISLNGVPRLAGAINLEDIKELIDECLAN